MLPTFATADSTSGSATSGITYKVSYDAGRNFGPTTALSTASSINLPELGITLMLTHAGSGDKLYTGDVFIFSTVGMTASASNASPNHGLAQCILAAAASVYSAQGWGSTHIIGELSEANAATLVADTTGTVDTLPGTYYVFTRALLSARDVSPPAIWGGTGESETTWMTDGSVGVVNTFAALSAKRACVGAGHYNIQSSIAGTAGAPAFRRPGMWAEAVRQLLIPPQRHSGRVKDGALGSIVQDPANDPLDGFVYHDERVNPGLDAARFCSFRTRKGRPGVFVANPNMMSPAGSYFTILPLGNVMDVACDIVHQVGESEINDDIRLNSNGTIVEKDARVLEGLFGQALKDQMLANSMISGYSVLVDRSKNVATTSEVDVAVTITARGYILSETITISYATASGA